MIPRPVIIDCDPGQDDAIALLIALASPEALQVLGVTCVGGNAPLNRTQTNARRICVLANRADLPVFAGCAGPLLRVLTTAQAVHGESGMDGSGLPDAPAMPLQERHAVDFIVDTCLAAAYRGITLCVLGPMTNIAVALTKAPDIAAKIRGIVFMGGVVHGPGNVTPSAEFNIFTDPHAARIVFACGAPLVMFGLDVTHKVITTPARLDAIAAIGTPVAAAAAGMLRFYDRRDIARYGAPGGPLHDPCVIAWLLQPDLFCGRHVHLAVETDAALTLGRTVADWWNVTDQTPNATIMDSVDADGFYALIVDRLSRL